jgi:hypothetical protein
MPWWLAPSIIGVIVAGVIIGLLISIIIVKFQKKNAPLPMRDALPLAQSTRPEPVVERYVPNIVINPEKPVNLFPDKVEEYLNGRKTLPTTTLKKSEALTELEVNLAIASKPITEKLVSYRTTVWNTKRSEFNILEKELLGELTEAYVDMLLANNLVWLGSELGRESSDMNSGYLKLSNKISERLQRIMPSIRDSFSQSS